MKKSFKDFYEGQIYKNLEIQSIYNEKNKYRIKCICLNCGKESIRRIDTIDNKCYCLAKTVDIKDSIFTTHPYLTKYILDEEYAKTRSAGSNVKTKVQCPICKYEKYSNGNKLTSRGFTCINCGKSSSMNEKCVSNIFKQIGVEYKRETTFEWIPNKFYDFYIPSKNMIVEIHGEQHYKQTSGSWGDLIDIIENDKIKEQVALDNNISIYLNIKSTSQDYKKITEDVLNVLKKYFDISKLDYNKLYENMFNSVIYDIIDYWNKGSSVLNISKEIDMSRCTVAKYLKIASENNMCDYTVDESIKRGSLEVSKKRKGVPLAYNVHNKKPIFIVETGETFDSITQLVNNSVRIFGKKVCIPTISKRIKDKKSLNGYHIEFVNANIMD